MPVPSTVDEFLALVRSSGLADPGGLDSFLQPLSAANSLPAGPKDLAALLVTQGILTAFQAEHLLEGQWRGFTLGKYQIQKPLGSGGMGIVYLAKHLPSGRLVAVKVLPAVLAEDPWFLRSFHKEARIISKLRHPNIVRALDFSKADKLYFLVMEYVDGDDLQDIVDRDGPLDFVPAAGYMHQAALGLRYLHEGRLVHRDIKPGNLMRDRQGGIKILDLGLAHLLKAKQKKAPAGKKTASARVGTDDYLAPEQIVDSDDVDIRADIYSLGATFYFLLTGQPPFAEVTLPYQKLLAHLARHPPTVRASRPETPADLNAVIEKMMAKNPWDRYQTPEAVVETLGAWMQTAVPAPERGR